jgi:hypothetical protein
MGKKQKGRPISATGTIVTLRIFLQLFRFAKFTHFAVESSEGNFSVKKAGPYQRRFLRQKS